jgi:lipoate---protein ligase
MLCLPRTETDPYFNLAAEEYVLKEFVQDVFMLWRNAPSVVICKHQNASAEVNAVYAFGNSLPVIRRISGGGTVYHDPGNLNYSFVVYGEKDKLVDYRKYTAPILAFLHEKGIEGKMEGKSNLVVKGRKFSGNSAHVVKNKIIHHGTLLFNSNLEILNEVLKPGNGKYEDKAVRSIRAGVVNLEDFFPAEYTPENFFSELLDFIKTLFKADIYLFNNDDRLKINRLADDKYRTWDWNYGYSPDYTFQNKFYIEKSGYSFQFDVSKGIIREISLTDLSINKNLKSLEKHISGNKHYYPEILETLRSVNFAEDIPGISLTDLSSKFF